MKSLLEKWVRVTLMVEVRVSHGLRVTVSVAVTVTDRIRYTVRVRVLGRYC